MEITQDPMSAEAIGSEVQKQSREIQKSKKKEFENEFCKGSDEQVDMPSGRPNTNGLPKLPKKMSWNLLVSELHVCFKSHGTF